ncbi:phage tail assembly chaperone [Pseudogemmobacter faecipullorum]|uniref:phage tail assembly chaperone n=1 Tax=Pseudogemmobacter faecipullorum TaxID=2755041 RepID=UPI003F497BFD
MRWALEEEAQAEIRRKRFEERGKPIPAHLWPPEILPGYEDWFAAFFELSTDRPTSDHGSGPIPAGSIARHCIGWPEDEQEAFRTCVRAMDAAWLKSQRNEPDLPESDNPARDAFRVGMGKGPTK